MNEFLDKMRTTFGAQYVAEDAASYILYCFDRSVSDGRAVPVERLARFLGLQVRCEYLTGDCTAGLGVVAFEPQRLYGLDGAIDLPTPCAVVERDVIDRGQAGLYRYTLAVMCAEYLFFAANHVTQSEGEQLSFGLDTVASANAKYVTLLGTFEDMEKREEGAATFALKLLLPKNGFKRRTIDIYARLGVNRATLDRDKDLPTVIDELAASYEAPAAAVAARLRQLRLL